MTEKRAIHIARHKVVQEANAHYFCPELPTKYLEFWRMALAALIKAAGRRRLESYNSLATMGVASGRGKETKLILRREIENEKR